jgi:uncharacterized protein (TIGR00369 family)
MSAGKDPVALLQTQCDASPFIKFAGIQVTAIDKEAMRVTFRAPFKPEFERGAGTGQWHGGPIAALIDTAGCMAVVAVAGRDAGTIDFRTDYLRPAAGPWLDAIGIVRRAGRTMGVADVDVFDSSGKLVATGRGSFFLEAAK